MTQRRGDLVDLFHSGTHRPATQQYQHVAGPYRMIALPLDRGDGLFLPGEDPHRTGLAVDSVGIDHAGVDRSALDDGPLRSQVPAGKGHGARQPLLSGARRAHDHDVGIDLVLFEKPLAQPLAAVAGCPPVESALEGFFLETDLNSLARFWEG